MLRVPYPSPIESHCPGNCPGTATCYVDRTRKQRACYCVIAYASYANCSLNRMKAFSASNSLVPLQPFSLSFRPLMSTDIWVLSYEHLRDHPRSNEALTLLQKVASLVKPIMRNHSWRLPVLAEFFPEEPGLLGAHSYTSYILWHRPGSCLGVTNVSLGMSKFTESLIIQ
jgi:hypothetical protein